MRQSRENTKLFLETGDLFNLSYGFDGIAAFIPCGLTAFRCNCHSFIKSDPQGIVMVMDENHSNKIYQLNDVRNMVFSALDNLVAQGATKIGMNAIRTKCGAGPSEIEVFNSCLSWLEKSESEGIKSITLVDLRGGFERFVDNNANFKISILQKYD